MSIGRHVDKWSWIVLAVTFILFLAALFLKGLSHDILLEAGVFLVSVKLMVMLYRNGAAASELKAGIDEVQGSLRRLEDALGSRRSLPPDETP
jgi:hypothetical protein